jgi:hypothetical protein
MRNELVMDQFIPLHEPNKNVRSEEMKKVRSGKMID